MKISDDKKQRLRELHELRPAYNWVLVLYLGLWAAAAAWTLHAPSLGWKLPGYALSGIMIQALAIVMHECVHAKFFDPSTKLGRWANRWVGVPLVFPILFSATAYRVSHLHHHRYERSIEDMDEFENFTRRPALLKLLLVGWLLIGAWYYPVHTAIHGLRLADAHERRAIIFEYALLAATLVLVFVLVPIRVVADVWLIPLIVTVLVTQVRGVAEHVFTPGDEPIRATRTVRSNLAVSLLMGNLNYHLGHHLFPGVPWYNQRKLYDLLLDDYQAAGASIYGSYLGFLWDFARVLTVRVPHSVAAPPSQARYYPHYMPILPGAVGGARALSRNSD